MNERWLEVRVVCPIDQAELVAELLHDLGSNGAVLEDTLDADRSASVNSDEVVVSGYFVEDDYLRHVGPRLQGELKGLAGRAEADLSRFHLLTRRLVPTDWSESWKEFYHVTHIDEQLVVVPEWEEHEPVGDEIVVRIDPGMAFGSGTHDSTRFALRAVHHAMEQFGRAPVVLDVGTGSGILALAALKLGADGAVGIDVDRHACERAHENAQLNGELERLTLVTGDLADYVPGARGRTADWYAETGTERDVLDPPVHTAQFESVINRRFDLVCANLTPDLLLYLAVPLRRVTHNGGLLAISGVTQGREEAVLTGLEDVGFVRQTRFSEPGSEWVAWLLRGEH